ncbi:MAG TPA: radical SAM protein [Thermoanaerobaculia bacterium]|nr:radical SAM protein [Thermoanaerobaculia bacterium]
MSASVRARLVEWEVTRACKLSCMHGAISAPRRSPHELSTYEAYKTIDQIVAIRPEEVTFTGGDPLERPDIFELVEYARRRGLDPALVVSPTPMLTGHAVGKLRRNGLNRIVLGIDSATPARHDAMRAITGQFTATLLATRWARSSDLALEVNTLVTHKNFLDLMPIANLITEIGAKRWNVYFPVPAGGKHIEMPTAGEVERTFATLQEIRNFARFSIRTFEAPHFRRHVLQNVHPAIDQFIAKDVAAEVVFISHTGEVSVSPFLPMTAGNVRLQPLSFIAGQSDLIVALRDPGNLKGKCGRCEYRQVCGGSRARAFAMTGDLFSSDPLCSHQPGAA